MVERIKKLVSVPHGVLLALVGIIYLAMSLNIAMGVDFEKLPDSSRYLSGDWFSTENTGVLTSVFFSLFGSSTQLIPVAQVAMMSVGWLAVAASLLSLLSGRLGYLLGIFTLLMSWQLAVFPWSYLALSESLTLTLFLFWLSIFLGLLSRNGPKRPSIALIAAWIGFSALVLAAKPQLFIIIAPITLAYLLVKRHSFGRGTLWGGIAGTLVISAAAIARLIIVSAGSPFRASYVDHLYSSFPTFRQYASIKLRCPELLSEGVKRLTDAQTSCAAIASSAQSGDISPVGWLLSMPTAVAKDFLSWYLNGAVFQNYSGQLPPLPAVWRELLLPLNFSISSLTAVALVAALVVCLFTWKNMVTSVARGIWYVSSLALIWVYIFISWLADGIEQVRHAMPIILLLPWLVFLMTLLLFKPKESPIASEVMSLEGDA